jgi:hypothetical protein
MGRSHSKGVIRNKILKYFAAGSVGREITQNKNFARLSSAALGSHFQPIKKLSAL